jgi:hypothetical protein
MADTPYQLQMRMKMKNNDGLVSIHRMSIKEAVVMECMWTQVMGRVVVLLSRRERKGKR